MNLSDEQIKHILQSTKAKIPVDFQLENTIMNEINTPSCYEGLIQKSLRHAKISLWTSIIVAGCLLVYLFYHLYAKYPLLVSGLERMYPSLAVVAVIFILYQLLNFSANLGDYKKYPASRS